MILQLVTTTDITTLLYIYNSSTVTMYYVQNIEIIDVSRNPDDVASAAHVGGKLYPIMYQCANRVN